MGQLGVSMLPTTILVDSSGVVRLFHVGYKPGFEKELEEIVKKHLPAKMTRWPTGGRPAFQEERTSA